MEIFIERIRELRENADIGQCEMGRVLGIGQSTYSKYESVHHKRNHFKLNHIILIAEKLNISPGELLAPDGLWRDFSDRLDKSSQAYVENIKMLEEKNTQLEDLIKALNQEIISKDNFLNSQITHLLKEVKFLEKEKLILIKKIKDFKSKIFNRDNEILELKSEQKKIKHLKNELENQINSIFPEIMKYFEILKKEINTDSIINSLKENEIPTDNLKYSETSELINIYRALIDSILDRLKAYKKLNS